MSDPEYSSRANGGYFEKQMYDHNYKNMKKKHSCMMICFGAAQIVIGFVCIVGNGVNFRILFLSLLGHGFITGIMFMVTGGIGIGAGTWKKKCLVVTFNILSIISAGICSYLFVVSVISADISKWHCIFNYYREYQNCDRENINLEIALAVMAIVEVIVAVMSSVLCCTIGACCCDCECGCCCPPSILPYKQKQQEQEHHLPQHQKQQQQQFLPFPSSQVQQLPFIVFPQQAVLPLQTSNLPNQPNPSVLLNPQQQTAYFDSKNNDKESKQPNPGSSGCQPSA